MIDNLSGLTSWNNSIGSQEARVDVELMEDMVVLVVRCYRRRCGDESGDDESKHSAHVCTDNISTAFSNSARHQSSRALPASRTQESLLRLRQLEACCTPQKCFCCGFEMCEGQALVRCAACCEAGHTYGMLRHYQFFLIFAGASSLTWSNTGSMRRGGPVV